ncbi:hypothetical protein GCM10010528_01650 [Gordonia defluvii]|jgi:CHASE2 domain-containing sensor protein|uniref:Uncharacterized protein n=1 Tax=Gordonia defluvii TaxID=283718 RepID=A0ABP6KX02_9ACTN|nr:hypothetical protein [Gordonia sp. UBA5067]
MLAVAAPGTDRVRGTVRGVAVGAFAASAAIAGHTVAMPADIPSIGSLVFVTAICGVLGAVASTSRRPTLCRLTAILAASQAVGHLTLSIGSAHPIPAPTSTMIAGHLVALVLGVAVVDAADRAARRALALLHRLLRTRTRLVRPGARLWALVLSDAPRISNRDAAGQHIRRGPPVHAAAVHP